MCLQYTMYSFLLARTVKVTGSTATVKEDLYNSLTSTYSTEIDGYERYGSNQSQGEGRGAVPTTSTYLSAPGRFHKGATSDKSSS